jgi:hypothetical protein
VTGPIGSPDCPIALADRGSPGHPGAYVLKCVQIGLQADLLRNLKFEQLSNPPRVISADTPSIGADFEQ